MAHYAFLNDANIVTEVIVGCNEGDKGRVGPAWEAFYAAVRGQRCLRTSFNTRDGVHLKGGVPFRGTYAGIGYRYDEERDEFVPPAPPPDLEITS